VRLLQGDLDQMTLNTLTVAAVGGSQCGDHGTGMKALIAPKKIERSYGYGSIPMKIPFLMG